MNTTQLKNLIISICSSDEQNKIVEEIETRLSECENIERIVHESLEKAEALKQNILHKAFSGKLVPQYLDDEPAEKLVERIKAEKLSK